MPIELLDVAGLVPGAHEGKGLGNKFLDDLRHADALVHVVDVSGTTDAEGESLLLILDYRSRRECSFDSPAIQPVPEVSKMLTGHVRRKGYERIRSIAGHHLATIRDCEMDTGQPNG